MKIFDINLSNYYMKLDIEFCTQTYIYMNIYRAKKTDVSIVHFIFKHVFYLMNVFLFYLLVLKL